MVLATLLVCGSCLAATSPAAREADAPAQAAPAKDRTLAAAGHSASQAAALRYLGQQVRMYQRQTWRWQRLMDVPRTDTYGRVLMELSVPDAEKAVELWRRHALTARRQAQHPPHLGAWLCIHHYEGSWVDHGAPYYGGLQMDIRFQRSYGGWLLRTKGTADRWTPLEQMWVAERGLKSVGFSPWPNTGRTCGVL